MDSPTTINPGGIQTSDTNLSTFYQRRGKLLTYHGGADNVSKTCFIASRTRILALLLLTEAAPFALTMGYYGNVRQTINMSMEQP